MGKKKTQKNEILDLEQFEKDQNKQISIQGIISDALCVSVWESHQLVAMIDIYGDLQIYDMINHSKIEYFTDEIHSEEIEYSKDPNSPNDIYYKLHFWGFTKSDSEEEQKDEEAKIQPSDEISLVFLNGYQNKLTTYTINTKISIKSEIKMPNAYGISHSIVADDSDVVVIGNTIGCLYFYNVFTNTFFKARWDYSDIVTWLMSLRKNVKNIDQSPIFAPIINKDLNIESDNGIAVIQGDHSAGSRVLIGFKNNLVILYDLVKEEIQHAFDIPEIFRQNIQKDR